MQLVVEILQLSSLTEEIPLLLVGSFFAARRCPCTESDSDAAAGEKERRTRKQRQLHHVLTQNKLRWGWLANC